MKNHSVFGRGGRCVLLIAAATAWTPGSVRADCRIWNQVAYSGGPGPRVGHAMEFDSRDLPSAGSILFGGYDGSILFGDTWRWDGATWTQLATTGPSARWYHSMVFDSSRGRVVLFGGSTTFAASNSETWEWDGAAWTLVTSVGPPIRIHTAMAYDEHRQRTVLFGGTATVGLLNDTWEWDGVSWTQVFPTIAPPVRANHGMAYDADCRMIVMHGGQESNNVLTDTWLFDGAEWNQLITPNPPNRSALEVQITYDKARHRPVMYCGTGANAVTPFQSTWELLGGDWENTAISINNGPVITGGIGMCYDSARGVTVIYGGGLGFLFYWLNPLNGLWEYSTPGAPVAVTQHPSGGSSVILSGPSTSFTVAASGTGPLQYQWRINGSQLFNAGAWSGVTTPTITITGFGYAKGAYDCEISNKCGAVRTDPVGLDVHCPGDADLSGIVDFSDVLSALANWGYVCP